MTNNKNETAHKILTDYLAEYGGSGGPVLAPDTDRSQVVYVMGSMRNPNIPLVANKLRSLGFDAFDDWYSPGPETDDMWQQHEKLRGRSYKEALNGWHAKDVFEFDKRHLDRCDIGLLVLPAGKSAHIELGYLAGLDKPRFVLFDSEPERYDVMLLFATDIFFSEEEMVADFKARGWC